MGETTLNLLDDDGSIQYGDLAWYPLEEQGEIGCTIRCLRLAELDEDAAAKKPIVIAASFPKLPKVAAKKFSATIANFAMLRKKLKQVSVMIGC